MEIYLFLALISLFGILLGQNCVLSSLSLSDRGVLLLDSESKRKQFVQDSCLVGIGKGIAEVVDRPAIFVRIALLVGLALLLFKLLHLAHLIAVHASVITVDAALDPMIGLMDNFLLLHFLALNAGIKREFLLDLNFFIGRLLLFQNVIFGHLVFDSVCIGLPNELVIGVLTERVVYVLHGGIKGTQTMLVYVISHCSEKFKCNLIL